MRPDDELTTDAPLVPDLRSEARRTDHSTAADPIDDEQ
jgi:hypothetical protein